MPARSEHRGPQAASEPIDVVTAFVWDGERVLLAQRSGEVSTFPGHWAGISGYVERADPLAQAYQELDEECGLQRWSLVLAAAGEPLLAAGEGRSFRVHPFLFRVHPPVELRHDWEAARFEWLPVADMLAAARQPAVPRLYETFARVWPPWPPEKAVEENLAAAERFLASDRSHGAAALAEAALASAAVAVRAGRPRFEALKPRILAGLKALAACRPSMQGVARVLEQAQENLASCDTEESALAALERLQQLLQQATRRSIECAASRIQPGEVVLVHSFSDSVLHVLLQARSRLRRVFVCEARPLCEGRLTAVRLAEAGIPVTLITDAQAALVMPQVSRVLLGADALCADGSIVNKAGSTLLALAARRVARPVTVAAQEIKRTSMAEPPLESAPPSEVWPDAPAGVLVQNMYFERVPAELVTEVVTELSGEPTAECPKHASHHPTS
ncbi:MAG: NUDIX domain-containing protein [Pirellulales bacterium]|nr:NUDIX domain-containing protein [Pirellulales bacterium]